MNYIPALLEGLSTTLFISIISLLIALVPGTLIFWAKRSKVKFLYFISTAYTEFFDAVPLLVQLFFVFYVLPMINPVLAFSPIKTSIFVLSLNAVSMITTTSKLFKHCSFDIQNASLNIKTLILSVLMTFRELIKFSTLLSMIAVTDLFKVSNQIVVRENVATIMIFTIITYLVLNTAIKAVVKILQNSFTKNDLNMSI